MSIAHYLRERRTSAGLTRNALGSRAGISPSLIQKLEQGTRTPTPEALAALYDALEVPPVFREHITSLTLPFGTETFGTHLPTRPTQAEFAFLQAFPHPASLQLRPTFEVIAINAPWAAAFPGLEPGVTLLEWMLLHPISREIVQEWRRQTHLTVYGFRVMGPGVLPPDRVADLVERLSVAPEWEEMWNSEVAAEDQDHTRLGIRNLQTGEIEPMEMLTMRFDMPRREWNMTALAPALPD